LRSVLRFGQILPVRRVCLKRHCRNYPFQLLHAPLAEQFGKRQEEIENNYRLETVYVLILQTPSFKLFALVFRTAKAMHALSSQVVPLESTQTAL
jgi:hypothetical protein